jgi:hypothetical protein
MWSLLQEAGAVPKQLVWDNESGIGQGRLTEPAAAFAHRPVVNSGSTAWTPDYSGVPT